MSDLKIVQITVKNPIDIRDETVLFFYVAKEGRVEGYVTPELTRTGDIDFIHGQTSDLGKFKIR